MKKYNTFLAIFLVYLLLNIVLLPKLYITATFNGIKAWAFNVLPSLLPFMILTKLICNLNVIEQFSTVLHKPCKRLFNCPSTASLVFATSVLSGYPVGASMTADLYQAGKISKSEAFRMCSFCSTSGPMFIIGSVGATMFGDIRCGYIILTSHILGALLNGLLYRNLIAPKFDEKQLSNSTSSQQDFVSIVQSSVSTILSIGAIIAFFFVVTTSLSPLFSIFPPQISCLLEGFVEITKGCQEITTSLNGSYAVIGATFIISFGGLSTILQSNSILKKLNMPIKTFIKQKITHALISVGIATLLYIIFIH